MIIATKIKPSFLIEDELNELDKNDLFLITGIDEAGRGPLCGPVVAASVILDRNNYPDQLNDSKKLNSKIRKDLFIKLKEVSRFGVGVVSEKIIDDVNILNATKLAMKISFDNLCEKYQIIPNYVIVDGNFIPRIDCPAKSIIKGDQKSLSIAAASIIAKETRDQIMENIGQEFPEYEWKKNKGYPTKYHYEMIKKYGTSKYHRQSFRLI
ncbi:MAG: ribonuclease HII [Rickettsiales bacterium]|jgi:ribonuclease HII